ncbi:MAG: hypothetical protein GY862_02265 [Gammaproteobacteria bacterium]|nr:hypothetical protein [Gammaproteobacteria bacterium]
MSVYKFRVEQSMSVPVHGWSLQIDAGEEYRISNIEYRISNIEYRISNIEY